jgi:hypothetical protein
MNLYLDCEWNGKDLISMALVAENDQYFYEVLDYQNPNQWVKDNVIPKLYNLPISKQHFQQRLHQFLNQFSSIHIVADWPEDIAHFCNALITGPGYRLDTPPLSLEVIRINAPSEDPHNALADARGIKNAHRPN